MGASGELRDVTPSVLDTINVAQCRDENKAALDALGGVGALLAALGVDEASGLSDDAVERSRAKFGSNAFAEKPMESFFSMFLAAFDDRVLQARRERDRKTGGGRAR